jgi:DNA polymerase IV (DinB-like DNA polymerase)
MSAAKIASDHDKPDGLVVVEPGQVREFLAPLDVGEIHGVGPVTARELREMGIDTAADLADADRAELEARFGERGAEMHRRARGEDRREVTPTGRPKSLSRESAFTEATDDDERKRDQIRTLAEAVADRARRKDAMYRTIGIKAVTPPYDVNTRAKSLPGPVDDPELVEEVALDLFEEFAGVEVRKVGVRVSNLSFAAGEQASLGDGWETTASESESGDAESESETTEDDGQRSLGQQWSDDSERGDSESGDSADERDGETLGADPDGQLSLGREWDGAVEAAGELASNDGENEDSADGNGESVSHPPDDSDPEGQVSLGDFE